jgi:hypothetical protein
MFTQIGFIEWARIPVMNDQPQTPTSTLRRDLKLIQVSCVSTALAYALAAGITFSVMEWVRAGFAAAIAAGLGAGVLGFGSGLVIGFIPFLATASGVYLCSVLPFGLKRRTPFRLMRFLDDAHRLGLLRQVGAVYQFRHAALQDHLAARHRSHR